MKDIIGQGVRASLIVVVTGLASVAHATNSSEVESRSFSVPSDGSKPTQYVTHGVRMGSGKLAVLQGMRSDELKARHQEYCKSSGGRDAYDETINVIGEDVVDVIVCQQEQSDTPASEVGTATITPYYTPSITLVPPNRNAPVNSNYTLDGYMHYSTNAGGEYSLAMAADKCSISNGGIVGSNVYNGRLNIRVVCVSHNAGTWPVYLNGCIPGLCATAIGEVRARH